MRRTLSLLTLLVAGIALLAPSQAMAFKPDIVGAYATKDNAGIRFTVKVRMDKGGRSQRDVNVTYKDETKNADAIEETRLSFYETGAYDVGRRPCYRIFVVAKNRHGTTREHVRAGRLGTDGC